MTRDGRAIRIATDVFARQVMLETGQYGVVFDGNHFDLPPGRSRVVQVLWPEDVDMDAIRVTCVNAKDWTIFSNSHNSQFPGVSALGKD